MFEKQMVNLWDFLAGIPSLEDPRKSIKEEIFDFNEELVSHARCRLLKSGMKKVDTSSYGFGFRDQADLLRLILTPESMLEDRSIEDWFSPHFFETPFWYLWRTTFAFQSWSSLVEMRRYFLRFLHLFPEFDRLGGILRTRLNQYDSIVLPVMKWLADKGVRFETNTLVTDVSFDLEEPVKRATALKVLRDGIEGEVPLTKEDFVFVTLGSIPAASSVGSWEEPAILRGKEEAPEWLLWDRIAQRSRAFGNPAVFDEHIDQSKWQSCTITLRNGRFFEHMESFTGNVPGTGGLITLMDSSWLLSFVLPRQPHFLDQPEDVWTFWAYGLFPDEKGNFVKKKMSDCTGREIVEELLRHLELEEEMDQITKDAKAIPCIMPFAHAEFQPRSPGDRPAVVPPGAENFAFLGQFTEISQDVVYTVEYSVRSARIAVYSLFDVSKQVPDVYLGTRNARVLRDAAKAMWR
jgi:oleate hydratase